jgi:hypothetical protein
VQAPVRAPADGVVPVDWGVGTGAAAVEIVPMGVAMGVVGLRTIEVEAGSRLIEVAATAGAEVVAEPESILTGTMLGEATLGVGVGVGTSGAGGAATELEATVPPEGTTAWLVHPVGAARLAPGVAPAYWTNWPGSGMSTSFSPTVPQPPPTEPMLARNIAGNDGARLENSWRSLGWGAAARLRRDGAGVTVMGAQFMYISRLPILLNQVHARL